MPLAWVKELQVGMDKPLQLVQQPRRNHVVKAEPRACSLFEFILGLASELSLHSSLKHKMFG